jgi:hypothetical protein
VPAAELAPRQPLLRPPEAGSSITPCDVEVTPQGISVRRVDRLLGGLLPSARLLDFLISASC